MKKTLFLLLYMLCFSTAVSAQSIIAQIISAIPVTQLPYPPKNATNKLGTPVSPNNVYSLPYKLWNGALNIGLWKDFNLTMPLVNDFDDCDVFRRFEPVQGNYYIALLSVGPGDHHKEILVTVNSNGQLLDQLEVAYFGYDPILKDMAYVKEFSLNKDVSLNRFNVVVYHLKPNNNIMFEQSRIASVSTIIPAKIFRDTYYINSAGKFIHDRQDKLVLKDTNATFTINDYKSSAPNFDSKGVWAEMPQNLIFPVTNMELMNASNFVSSQGENKSLEACNRILQNHGLSAYGDENHVYKLLKEEGTGYNKWLSYFGDNSPMNYANAVNCINRHLNAGRPIIVGVNWQVAHNSNEGVTDHFIVITGRKCSTVNRTISYTYYDPGTSMPAIGCNKDRNLLIYDPISCVFYNNDALMGPARYDVTQVRPNDGITEGTISQYQN